MPFISRIPIRFGDVDSARIVYYPRLYHLLHVAFEELVEAELGIPYDRLISERNIGLPTVHVETDFHAPIRFGETIEVAITVPKVGASSVVFDHRVLVPGPAELRVTTSITRVAVAMDTLKPLALPDDLRECLLRLAS